MLRIRSYGPWSFCTPTVFMVGFTYPQMNDIKITRHVLDEELPSYGSFHGKVCDRFFIWGVIILDNLFLAREKMI